MVCPTQSVSTSRLESQRLGSTATRMQAPESATAQPFGPVPLSICCARYDDQHFVRLIKSSVDPQPANAQVAKSLFVLAEETHDLRGIRHQGYRGDDHARRPAAMATAFSSESLTTRA